MVVSRELLTLGEQVGARLKARGETVGVAESAAGGLISATLLAVSGASAYFRGGTVCYTGYARTGFLRLPPTMRGEVRRSVQSSSSVCSLRVGCEGEHGLGGRAQLLAVSVERVND